MEVDVVAPDKQPQADHLCVLVHGLWGNPHHLDYLASALRERYSEDRLVILAVKRNAGSFTYDGIELGGERVAHEIEETLEKLAARGYNIKKLSMVGYSLGGLVARYALGLLDSRGWLDKLEPVNFTTFVSPHVGVRTPLKGIHNHMWNVLGARTVSMSGRQLFMIDSFRDTGKPLLSVLADPDSIFMRALAKFKHRSVYANIVNDRTTAYYTTAISKVDLFEEPEKMNLNYVKGYEPVIVDPDMHVLPQEEDDEAKPKELPSAFRRTCRQCVRILAKLPFWIFIWIFLAIGSILFLLNSVVQTVRSHQRIRLHEEGKTGVVFGGYRVPLIVQDVRDAVEEVIENVNATQDPDYATPLMEDSSMDKAENRTSSSPHTAVHKSSKEPPTLALTPAQFAIIDSLNAIGFRKYPVYIHKDKHSHAAIIVRVPKKSFEEGKIVVKHWLDNEFKI
ncbi:putative lipase/serine esterase [Thermoascus aurantiacus ATCC 26904]